MIIIKKTLYCYSNNLLFLSPHVSLCISNKICKNDSIINSEVCFQKKKLWSLLLPSILKFQDHLFSFAILHNCFNNHSSWFLNLAFVNLLCLAFCSLHWYGTLTIYVKCPHQHSYFGVTWKSFPKFRNLDFRNMGLFC